MMSTPSSTKKRRITRNTNKTHQKPLAVEGDKKQFLALPLDVIIEVFQRLEPVDIIHLARTTKGLRAFLFDRHRSRHVWKTAIGNVPDLPPCPDHLSEPAYTHLAFVPVCHGCFKPCATIEWELRMRCCPNCLPKMTVFITDPPHNKTMQRSYSVRLPVATGHYELQDRGAGMRIFSVRLDGSYRASDWENFMKRTKRISRATKKFVERENELWEPIVEHARQCREWEFKRLTEHLTRIRLVREERANDIKRNLEALGWTNELYYSTAFLKLRTVSKAEPLTPAEWSKISPKLVASLPKVRLVQIAEIYRDRLAQFISIIPLHIQGLRVRPRPIDIFLHQDVRDVLEKDISTEMRRDTMEQKLGPILPDIMQQWSDGAVDALASLAQQQLGSEATVDPSNVVFRCARCQERMGFDVALSHRDLYPLYTITRRKREYVLGRESRVYEGAGKELYYSCPRNLRLLRVDRVASQKDGRLG
ncbi:hypothetical protein OG21DRAFT_1503339 [Imleria badia]|nr:hypothetical protein OG21DRAFT_1503339 [Imleria badia]